MPNMFKSWKDHHFFKVRGTDAEREKEGNEGSDVLLPDSGHGRNEKPRSLSLATADSNPEQPSVRYVGFGIGGAGNIRRWVCSDAWLPQPFVLASDVVAQNRLLCWQLPGFQFKTEDTSKPSSLHIAVYKWDWTLPEKWYDWWFNAHLCIISRYCLPNDHLFVSLSQPPTW